MKALAATLGSMVLAAIAGCAAGPDYQRPAAPRGARYTAEPLAAPPGQRFAPGQDLPARWWTLFGSNALNQLVEAALHANPDLQAAEAALRAARETAAAQRGAYFPSATLHPSSVRQNVASELASPLASGSDLFTLHTVQLDIAYVVDVFGGIRRQVEASAAQAEVARFQRHAAWQTLTANVVAAAVQEAALRDQLQVSRELVGLARELLAVVNTERRVGQVGAAEVAAQEAVLAQALAGVPPLEKQLAQQRSLITVLAGRLPSEEVGQHFALSALRLPQELPLSVPARLVEQRPDVRAAEAQLHAASAQVGIAAAARLPEISLTASLGSAALTGSSLFQSGSGFWSIGADLVQPLLRGGALRHQQRAAEAAYEQAAAQYRSTVLHAFQDVADTLHAIEADGTAWSAAVAAEQAARTSLAIALRQREVGLVGYLAVLQAQQALRQALLARVQAQASRLADCVALFQALGGGWWRQDQASGVLH
ncbi:efflux transporter outer membrane subunit [Massilia horti]|uniref:Efflux transporter outer membrane subunit n=1 Tax=Massilia horti TaxID=2562153 RepID=A0A4Y9T536_9BURK|nr:efflux transporter outer membrane subunit [Massilia horti]TFW35771.1 efflux transporter outer membrane subunit [Massilia horti]